MHPCNPLNLILPIRPVKPKFNGLKWYYGSQTQSRCCLEGKENVGLNAKYINLPFYLLEFHLFPFTGG